jgi:hypothetical protein
MMGMSLAHVPTPVPIHLHSHVPGRQERASLYA